MVKEFSVEWREKNDNEHDDDDGITQSEMAWCNNGFDDEQWTNSKFCKKNLNTHTRSHMYVYWMHAYYAREDTERNTLPKAL